MRNVSGESCREKKNIHFIFKKLLSPENRAACEIMWKKYGTAGQTTDENIARRMRIACRITKATDTHSEYVITIPFPRQQWLRECASLLRYTYRAMLTF